MLGINKRLDKIEYRLARIDKMLEDILTYVKGKKPSPTIEDAFIKQFESEVRREYDRLGKEYKSVVVHKPRLKQNNWYPDKMATYMTGRYRTVEQIALHLGCKNISVNTYLKHMRRSGVQIMKRGRAPTEYKIYNPHKGAKPNG
jgi:biotin operon repressor